MTKLQKVLNFMNYRKNYNFTWKSFQSKFPGYPSTETNYLAQLVAAQYVIKTGRGKYHVAILPSVDMGSTQLKREAKSTWNSRPL